MELAENTPFIHYCESDVLKELTNILADYTKNHRSYREEFVGNPCPQKPEFLRLIAFYRNEDDWTSWGKAFNKSLESDA